MFKNTTQLVTTNNLKTYIGTEFEGMFQNSAIQCIGEIYTCLANFPPSYISCSPNTKWICANDVVCADNVAICSIVSCSDSWDKFAPSTMFSGATSLTAPDVGQQTMITNRFHYVGVNPC